MNAPSSLARLRISVSVIRARIPDDLLACGAWVPGAHHLFVEHFRELLSAPCIVCFRYYIHLLRGIQFQVI